MTEVAHPTASTSATLRDAWAHQASWSAAASAAKQRLERARTAVVFCTVVAAVLETLAAQLSGDDELDTVVRLLAGTGAVLLALASFLQLRAASKDQVSAWVRARSVSEALKEAVYRYLSGSGPYRQPDAAAVLRETCLRIMDQNRDLQSLLATTVVAAREPPAVVDLAGYVQIRVEAQIDRYYLPRARELARRGQRWRQAQMLTLLAGAALSALLPYLASAGVTAWVAVITTVAGSLGAHIEASRFEQLAIGYQATASRLQALRAEWIDSLSKTTPSDADADTFIDRCEDAISVENQAWMAEWAK